MDRFRVHVNEQICIGAGVCEEMMAEVFRINGRAWRRRPPSCTPRADASSTWQRAAR